MGLFDIFKKKKVNTKNITLKNSKTNISTKSKTFICQKCGKELAIKYIYKQNICVSCFDVTNNYQSQAKSSNRFSKVTDTFVCSKCGKKLAKKYMHKNNLCAPCATSSPPTNSSIIVKAETKRANALSSTCQQYNRTIHSAGVHAVGSLYEEVAVKLQDGKYFYTTLSMTDKYNAGGHREEIPKNFFINDNLDESLLLDYVAIKHTYMETLSHRRNSARLCFICKMPFKNGNNIKINNHLLCDDCYQKINIKHE